MQNLASIASTVQKTFKQVGARCVTGVKRSAHIVGYVNKYLLVAVANTINTKYLGQKRPLRTTGKENELYRLKNDKIVVSQETYNALLLHVKKMVVIAGTQVKQPMEFGFVNELQHETAVRRVEHRAA
jgi:hypothetical protein